MHDGLDGFTFEVEYDFTVCRDHFRRAPGRLFIDEYAGAFKNLDIGHAGINIGRRRDYRLILRDGCRSRFYGFSGTLRPDRPRPVEEQLAAIRTIASTTTKRLVVFIPGILLSFIFILFFFRPEPLIID